MMTTTTNDDDGGDGATGDEVNDDGDGATGNDDDDDDNGGADDDGDGATGDGSQNSQTDYVLTIVAHTMTAKLIGGGMFHLCLLVRHKFYVRDFRTKRKILSYIYSKSYYLCVVFLL